MRKGENKMKPIDEQIKDLLKDNPMTFAQLHNGVKCTKKSLKNWLKYLETNGDVEQGDTITLLDVPKAPKKEFYDARAETHRYVV